MRQHLVVCLCSALGLLPSAVLAAPGDQPTPPLQAAAAACGVPDCGAPRLSKAPSYPRQIAHDADFAAEVTLEQPCSCTRRLNMLVAFTPQGGTRSREHVWKLDVAPGTTTAKLALTHAQLVKEKINAAHYTLTFTLFDEREKPSDPGKLTLSGLPFSLGDSKEALSRAPVVPTAIAREGELAVPFVFSNTGDIAADATALIVFTRPDAAQGIEYYKPKLSVPPGGATHVLRLSAEQRKKLGVGPGAWLVTASAFNGAGERLASFPGNLLAIGKVLSQPAAPVVSAAAPQSQGLTVTLTLNNDADVSDKITAVLSFSRPDLAKPIEYKVEGIEVPVGKSTRSIILTGLDLRNLGLRPGRWRVSVSALDRANKRSLEPRRGNDADVRPDDASLSSK
jgi:hypothetical protein